MPAGRENFHIELLPARHGDCLWIEYGDPVRPCRILIDGGPAFAYPALRRRIEQLPEGDRRIDLLVVTHIDADHIEGAIRLLRDTALGLSIGDIWYNAWRQLVPKQKGLAPVDLDYGALQGEYLSALIQARRLPWNKAFDGGPVRAGSAGEPPVRVLAGGARATILSPTEVELERLRDTWESELEGAGLEPDSPEEAMRRLAEAKRLAPPPSFGLELPDIDELAGEPFNCDRAVANGSSIALLLEHEGRRCLLLGDAHPDVVEASIMRLPAAALGPRLAVDVVKIPHHGSRNNVSRSLLERLQCDRFLISSDGSYFNHPDPEAIARLIKSGSASPELVFNYRSRRTAIWDDPRLREQHAYRTVFPQTTNAGVIVDVVRRTP